uniref:Uncharacterized protein n=1 Tax=Arundo donax TaxID=35708 RepID=A0A0A8YYN1_ARUDO
MLCTYNLLGNLKHNMYMETQIRLIKNESV